MHLPDPVTVFIQLIFIATLFYFLIPITGAFFVRFRWRAFRKNLRRSLDFPLAVPKFSMSSGSLGMHRFLGFLEAVEGSDILWIKGPHGSITANLRNAEVYNLTDPGTDDQVYSHLYPYSLPKVQLTRMTWDDTFSLIEGTKLFLFGNLDIRNGKYCFGSCNEMPLTVIIYNEDPFTLIPRCIWSGRQSNEFWNFLTPWSIITGSLLLLIFTAWLFQNSSNYRVQLIGLFLSLLPVIIFFPPGVFLFNLYKIFWDRSRKSRAERDLMRLPLSLGDSISMESFDCPEDKILYTRRPTEWPESEKERTFCCRLPYGLLEMSEKALDGECISYPEHPEILAKFCQRRAFLYESLSGVVQVSGLILNYFIIWFVINLIS